MSGLPEPVERLLRLYRAALQAADPAKVVPPYLPPPPRGRTVVVGMGKAAAAMAEAVEAHWHGPLEGVVVVPPGAGRALRHVRVMEGSHPVPDERSVAAGNALLAAVSNLRPTDLVLALISGGGSALSALPAAGLDLLDKQKVTRHLLRTGASIAEINIVRRHLSAIKGGRLAARAYPARVVTLVISDVPGDDPASVASGPTLGDASTCADALKILNRYRLDDMPWLRKGLESGAWESVFPDDPRLSGNTCHVIATGAHGLEAAAREAVAGGWPCPQLADSMEGEAREMAKAQAGIVLSVAERSRPFAAPCVLISGGEATVTLRGQGRGGRNTEFALAMAMALEARPSSSRVWGLSAGTDGLDGASGAAGAWFGPDTLNRARSLGIDPRAHLDSNDSASLFDAIGGLIHTGPTFTNINDFRAILVEALP